MDIPEKTQSGIPPNIKNPGRCDKIYPSSIILKKANSKTFTSHIAENIYKASTEHQLSFITINRKLNFYNIIETDTKKAKFLDKIKNPLHISAISKLHLGNHWNREMYFPKDSWAFENLYTVPV